MTSVVLIQACRKTRMYNMTSCMHVCAFTEHAVAAHISKIVAVTAVYTSASRFKRIRQAKHRPQSKVIHSCNGRPVLEAFHGHSHLKEFETTAQQAAGSSFHVTRAPAANPAPREAYKRPQRTYHNIHDSKPETIEADRGQTQTLPIENPRDSNHNVACMCKVLDVGMASGRREKLLQTVRAV
jgi:hypothetical protein